MKKFYPILLVLVLAALAITATFWSGHTKVSTTPEQQLRLPQNQTIESQTFTQEASKKNDGVSTNFYIAQRKDGKLGVIGYDFLDRKTIETKLIDPIDYLSFNTANGSSGASYSVQFDRQEKNIFYLTDGVIEGPGGGGCANQDGTCGNRIYKLNLTQDRPKKVYETTDRIQHWILHPDGMYVFVSVSALEKNTQVVQRVNISNGVVDEIARFDNDGTAYSDRTRLEITDDGRYLYQAYIKDRLTLGMRRVDTKTGELTSMKISTGWYGFVLDTDISPDGKQFAFYEQTQDGYNLFIYNLVTGEITQVPFSGSVGNYGLTWTAESDKIFYILKDRIEYYDVQTKQRKRAVETPDGPGFIFSAGYGYLMFESDRYDFKVYNYQLQKLETVKDLVSFYGKNHSSNVLGIVWY